MSALRIPRTAPDRKTFSLPVSSGWNPVPTSSSEPTRPRTRTWPSVGGVIRERILSRVDLPAPLRPMMPTTSPSATSKDTLRSAQKVPGAFGVPPRPRTFDASSSPSSRYR